MTKTNGKVNDNTKDESHHKTITIIIRQDKAKTRQGKAEHDKTKQDKPDQNKP